MNEDQGWVPDRGRVHAGEPEASEPVVQGRRPLPHGYEKQFAQADHLWWKILGCLLAAPFALLGIGVCIYFVYWLVTADHTTDRERYERCLVEQFACTPPRY